MVDKKKLAFVSKTIIEGASRWGVIRLRIRGKDFNSITFVNDEGKVLGSLVSWEIKVDASTGAYICKVTGKNAHKSSYSNNSFEHTAMTYDL